jgi:hypothetical protein
MGSWLAGKTILSFLLCHLSMYVCSTHTPRSNIIYYHRLRVVYYVYMYLTYFAQMELQCGLKRWEAAEVKSIKCTPFGERRYKSTTTRVLPRPPPHTFPLKLAMSLRGWLFLTLS